MKRWFWSVLMIAAAVAALTVGASARPYSQSEIDTDSTLIVGPVIVSSLNPDGSTGSDSAESNIIVYEISGNTATVKGFTTYPTGSANTAFTIPDTFTIPQTTDVKTVVGIDAGAFSGCDGLYNVIIGNKVTSIGNEAFSNCTNLKLIRIPDVVSDIGTSAFAGCTNLNNVILPGSLNEIKTGTFAQCGNLSLIYLPPSVRSIAMGAFDGVWPILHRSSGTQASIQNPDNLTIHDASAIPGREDPAATCVTHGLQQYTYTCSNRVVSEDGTSAVVCGVSFYINQLRPTALNPDRHPGEFDDYAVDNTANKASVSTCITKGWTQGKICRFCGNEVEAPQQLDFDSGNHEGTLETIPATSASCTQDAYPAYQEYTCCHVAIGKAEEPTEKAWGHDFSLSDEQFQTLINNEIIKKDYPRAKCFEFDLTYTVSCTRNCGEEGNTEERTKHIGEGVGDRIPHSMNTAVPDPDATSATDPRVDDSRTILATCDNDGQLVWVDMCTECGKTGEEHTKLYNRPDSDTHTYYRGNAVAWGTINWGKINPTCLYDGVDGVYLVCDGADTHAGLPKSCDDCDKFFSAASAAIEELEKACKALQEDPDQQQLADSLESLRETAKAAAKDYTDHLATHKQIDPEYVSGTVDSDKLKAADENEGVVKMTPLEISPNGEDLKDRAKHPAAYLRKKSVETILDDSDCTIGGKIITIWVCDYCGTEFEPEVEIIPGNEHHNVPDDMMERIAATCTEPEMIKYAPGAKCQNENCEFEAGDNEPPIPVAGSKPLGHDWVFESDEVQEDHCRVVTGRVHCSREYEEGCGATSETRTIAVSGLLGHTWGDWITTKRPTATEEGEETHYCEVCYKYDETAFETRKIPATGVPDDGDDDDGSGGSGSGGSGSGGGTTTPDPTTSYTITVISPSNGYVYASRSSATSGTSVTITVSPDSGYELDMLRVTTATSVVSTSNLGGGRYRFTMPAASVEIRATFSRVSSRTNVNWTGSATSSSQSSSTTQNVVQSVPKAGAWGQLFSDIPASHWAAGEINWANQMGYMNGTSGAFNPNGNITHQQMWMVLARLTGNNPANMADARRWAVNGGFADGSAPEGAVSRHQLVTALYRCAHLMGTSNRNTTSLAGFPDSRTVPAGARDAFAWAVANGIIGGNANGRLDPNGTLTRAQFAVILYRFSQRV